MTDYFTIAEFRGLAGMDDVVKYDDTKVAAARSWSESVIETFVGTSFVERTVAATLDGSSAGYLDLDPFARAVSAVSVGGVAYSGPQLALLTVNGGMLRQAVGYTWPYGYGNVAVTYTTGYSTTPPEDVKQAAMDAARFRLLTRASMSSYSSRTTSVTNDAGTSQLAIATEDNPTGLPDVDSVLRRWRSKLNVFGFA